MVPARWASTRSPTTRRPSSAATTTTPAGPRLLRLPRRDTVAVGRRRRRSPRPRRRGHAGGVRGGVRPGGFRRPAVGRRLVATRRPGFELVVAAHKSVAVLGVIGRAEDDALDPRRRDRRDAGLARRLVPGAGAAVGAGPSTARPTGGLTYAAPGTPPPGPVTRRRTTTCWWPTSSRCSTTKGGFKGLDTAALRDTVEAATMVGRLASAARAVSWASPSSPTRAVGEPAALADRRHPRRGAATCSPSAPTRSTSYLAETGHDGYRARGVAARNTRTVSATPASTSCCRAGAHELADDRLDRRPTRRRARPRASTSAPQLPLAADRRARSTQLAADVLDVEGELLRRHKVFTRTQLIAEVAPASTATTRPSSTGSSTASSASRAVVPLIGVAGAREQAYATARGPRHRAGHRRRPSSALADRAGPPCRPGHVATAIDAQGAALGPPLTDGQRAAVERSASRVAASTVVVGVAGVGQDHRPRRRPRRPRARRLPGPRRRDLRPSRPHPRHRSQHRGPHLRVAALAARPRPVTLDDRTVVDPRRGRR